MLLRLRALVGSYMYVCTYMLSFLNILSSNFVLMYIQCVYIAVELFETYIGIYILIFKSDLFTKET
jgi:hypothetical protein